MRLGTVLLGVVIVLAALVANAQDVALAPPPNWAEIVARALFNALVLTAAVEVLRWLVPGWGREKGPDGKRLKLPPSARRVLFVVVVAGGQVQAWAGAVVLPPGWDDVATLAGAGLVVSGASLVLNETIWKFLMRKVRERTGGGRRRREPEA